MIEEISEGGKLSRPDVLIIGAGITGCCIAYHLTRLGIGSVLVLEKTGLASGPTGACPGGIRQQFGTEINCRLARAASIAYGRINEELDPEHEIRVRRGGYLFAAYSRPVMDRLERNVGLQRSLGIPSRIVSREEIGDLAPAINSDGMVGGTWCQEDGYADDAYQIAAAFWQAAARGGARLRLARAEALLSHGDRVTGVRVDGETVHAGVVVNAAGWESPALSRTIGVELPIDPERRYLAFTRPVAERLLEPLVVSPERQFAAKQMYDGTMLCSYLGPLTHGDREEWEFQQKTAEVGIPILPALADLEFLRSWSGYYDSTPDHQAILGGVDGLHGYYHAVGFSGHGFMLGPVVGRLIAEMIAGREPFIDVSCLHFRRFARNELIPEPVVV
ncbi:MAG: NAD(P)/FAD-dependent oxidoreductase [Chloroflexota bacterium]